MVVGIVDLLGDESLADKMSVKLIKSNQKRSFLFNSANLIADK